MFEQEAFASKVGNDYILVSLDFPNGEEAKAKVPNPERNEELMQKYGIQGFPTVLLMTAKGEVFGQSGYTGATPEDYLADVLKQRVEGKAALAKVQELLEAFDKAEDKMSIVEKALAVLEEQPDSPVVKPLADLARKCFELDPEDTRGLKIKALTVLLKSNNASDDEIAMAAEADKENVHGLLEQVVGGAMNRLRSEEDLADFMVQAEQLYATGKVHDKELIGFLWVNAAYFCHKYLDRPDEAKTWAKRAKAIGGLEDAAMEVLKEILGDEDPS